MTDQLLGVAGSIKSTGRVVKRCRATVAGQTRGATGDAPTLAVLTNPVEQGAFKTDVVSKPFGFNPFMAKNLFSFS